MRGQLQKIKAWLLSLRNLTFHLYLTEGVLRISISSCWIFKLLSHSKFFTNVYVEDLLSFVVFLHSFLVLSHKNMF